MKKLVSREVIADTVMDDGRGYDVNGIETHNCCRLRLDLREIRKNITGGLFGSGENTGSVGVVTINMPRIGFLARDEKDFFDRLNAMMDIAAESLDIKRKFIEKTMEQNLYPYTKRYLGHLNNHFSTIGVIGFNECCMNFLHKSIAEPEGLEFTKRVLTHMRDRLSDYQEKTGALFNLESTPAESTSYRFAKHDIKKYPGIITAGTSSAPFYTNSSNLPVNHTTDPWEAIKHQSEIQPIYTGGTVFHTYMAESIAPEQVKDFLKKVIENTPLPYITMTPTFSTCIHGHGYIKGDVGGVCPICKQQQLEEYTNKLTDLKRRKETLKSQSS
jgi:ribonucleoside-triphosphate reductase